MDHGISWDNKKGTLRCHHCREIPEIAMAVVGNHRRLVIREDFSRPLAKMNSDFLDIFGGCMNYPFLMEKKGVSENGFWF